MTVGIFVFCIHTTKAQIYAQTYPHPPAPPIAPYYECNLKKGVATINWYKAYLATSYDFRFDESPPSWNNNCKTPNKGDICLSTKVNEVIVPVKPLVRYSWWVHAVNPKGSSDALRGEDFTCEIPLAQSFHYNCFDENTRVELSWRVDEMPDSFEVRFDAQPDSWSGNCLRPNSNDICVSTPTNKIVAAIKPGIVYSTWVHSVQSKVWSQSVQGPQIKCENLEVTEPDDGPTDIITPDDPDPPNECTLFPMGDANCDNVVDLLDYVCWKSEFADHQKAKGCLRSADFNSQNGVSMDDFEIWKLKYLLN